VGWKDKSPYRERITISTGLIGHTRVAIATCNKTIPRAMPSVTVEPRAATRRFAGEDAELKQFRELMPPPDHWEEGFDVKAMIGAVFVGLVMTPASMYMNLVVGADIGSAAQW